MIYPRRDKILFPFILKALLIVLLLFGMFAIVYLRSRVMKLEYAIGSLEKTKMEYLKERKMLLAEKTSLLSFERIEASLGGSQKFVLPDRIRVINVEEKEKILPHIATYNKQLPKNKAGDFE